MTDDEDGVVAVAERRSSTTVIMTNYDDDGGEARARRRLSKQNAMVQDEEEEPTDTDSRSPERDDTDASSTRRLHRENAIIVEEEVAAGAPANSRHVAWCSSTANSRDSCDYSDRSGIDLRAFLQRTLHKSDEDRQQLMRFEQQLTQLVMDPTNQSLKFELPSSYHRMLLHRCAAWFGLDHNVTNKHTEIVVNKSDKTKLPDEPFSSFVTSDDFFEPKFSPRRKHVPRGTLTDCPTRRAQSFDIAPPPPMHHVAPPPPPPSSHHLCVGMRQLSLQCTHQPRSFDGVHHHQHVYPSPPTIMRKAESFGGMPFVVHHHHHHHNPQGGYHVEYSPQPPPPPCYPDVLPYYEPQCVAYLPPPHLHPPMVHYPPPGTATSSSATSPYVQFGPASELLIDPIVAQPFPPVGHFSPNETLGIVGSSTTTSTQRAHNATRFIKTSMDGGYGSMNQDVDSCRDSESNSVNETTIEQKS